ncbi:Bacterial regulatory proteins, tetR family [Arthrobacter saudimassiliensis]|uniref:Bacterial regulatory proteins, tetR family n=1 Tax=Arthrobacter saudimassiliensis TaxID=1461584 RepID=A0A078MPW5_9MICC|nr:Bacterial regulatory proteins, tetR family [Arthrobacter saudimassiliensis]
MIESASDDGGAGLRERKRRATRIAITEAARALTAAHGVGGFTVEELCEEVGISRRTFFNYFPAKEDAILGSPVDEIPEDLVERFVAGGSGTRGDGLSPTLLADFVDLATAMMDRMAMTRDEMSQLQSAVAAEPRLLHKVLHGTQEAENHFAGVLSRREGLDADDPRIRLMIGVLNAVLQRVGPAFFTPGNTRPYRELITEALNAVRSVFAAVDPVPALPSPPRSPKESA